MKIKIKELLLNRSSKTMVFALTFVALMLASTVLVFSAAPSKAQSTATTIPSNMLQYETPQIGVDPEGTCFTQGPAPSAPNIAWKAQIPFIGDYPIAFNGLVFVHDFTTVYALDGGSGKIVWQTSNAVGSIGSMCKIDDTHMVIGSSCYNIATGTKLWDGPPEFHIDLQKNGVGYIADLKMFVDYDYGWNLPDPSKPPTLAWNRTLEYDVGHGFLAAYGDGKVFNIGEDNFIRAIDARTGKVVWQSPCTSQGEYGGVFVDGKIIHGGLDNNMRAWDANTGELLWTYNPGTWYGQWASKTCAAYGMVYEHNQDNYLYAINATTGQLVWRQLGPGIGYSGCLVIGDGKVYSPMGERQYRDFNTGQYAYSEYDCYDAYNGKLIWTLPLETGAAYEGHECIAYGNLYIIPITGTNQVPGQWTYGTFGFQSLGVWCISSKVQDWSMFMADPEHSAEGAGPTNLTLRWKYQAGAVVVSQPTESNGVTYFGSLDGNIYALDANTGAKLWTYKTNYEVKSSVAVVSGKLYTGADDGNIYCLDANTGTKVWETFAGGVTKNLLGSGPYLNIAPPVRSSPMVVDNRVYVGALDGNLYCLDANSGNTIWKFQTQGPILATPTIVDGRIYFPSCTGGYPIYLAAPSPYGDFYCLDANNAAVIWHKQIPYVLNRTVGWGNYIFASPTVAQGMVFVSNGYWFNYGLNATTGETIWTTTQRYAPGTGQDGGVIQMNAPLYKFGKLYFNDYYGITCRNATDGTELWFTYISRENLDQGLTYAYNRVYTVTEFGVLYVLDALTGQKLSYNEFGSYQMHSSPSLYNGSLYVGCNDMNVYCFGDSRTINAQPPTQNAANTQPVATSQPATKPTAAVTATPNAAPTATPPSSSASSTNATSDATIMYIGVAAVVVIVVIMAAVVLSRRKKA